MIEPFLTMLKVILINFSIGKKFPIFRLLKFVLILYEENHWFRGMENILEINREKNMLKK